MMTTINWNTILDEDIEEGSIAGYVTNTRESEQLENYLEDQNYGNMVQSIQEKYEIVAILKNLYVQEECRNEGFGNSLVSIFIGNSEWKKANAIILIADTAEDNNIDLVEWYESFGFKIIAGKRDEFPLMLMEL